MKLESFAGFAIQRPGRRASWLVALMMMVAIPGAAWGQQAPQPDQTGTPDESETTILEKISELSRLSKTADSATQYTTIIEQANRLLATGPADSRHVSYLQSLKSWALNRRAQTRIDLAGRFEGINNLEQARQVRDSALSDLDAALEADENRWQALRNRAILLTETGQYEPAVADWTRLIQMRPETKEAWAAIFNRAELRYELNDHDAALADYRSVLDENPQDLPALNGCGNCCLALGHAEQAIEYYDQILAVDAANPGALVNRGDARLALQQWSAAANDYRAATDHQDNGRTLQRLAWLLATCPDETVVEPAAALNYIRRAIELDGESAIYLDTLAAAWAASGEFEKARDVQTRAIGLAGDQSGEYQVRQTLYEQNEPFRQPPVSDPAESDPNSGQ